MPASLADPTAWHILSPGLGTRPVPGVWWGHNEGHREVSTSKGSETGSGLLAGIRGRLRKCKVTGNPRPSQGQGGTQDLALGPEGEIRGKEQREGTSRPRDLLARGQRPKANNLIRSLKQQEDQRGPRLEGRNWPAQLKVAVKSTSLSTFYARMYVMVQEAAVPGPCRVHDPAFNIPTPRVQRGMSHLLAAPPHRVAAAFGKGSEL